MTPPTSHHATRDPHSLQEEGTLIGTALAVCLGYWLLMSTLVFFGAYLLNMALSFLQVLSLMVSTARDDCSVTMPPARGSGSVLYVHCTCRGTPWWATVWCCSWQPFWTTWAPQVPFT